MTPHRTDGVSLVFGLVFLFAAGLWLVAYTTSMPVPTVGWLVVGGLGALGLLGIIRVLVRS